MTLLLLAWLGAVAASTAAPSPGQGAAPNQARQPAETNGNLAGRWKLTALGDTAVTDVAGGREPHLTFYSGTVNGFDGCNSLSGGFKATRDQLTFDGLMGTLMACPLPDNLDRRMREAMMSTRTWKVAGTVLALYDAKGTAVAKFERSQAQ